MILLTLNRCAGCNFVRWMSHAHHTSVNHAIMCGENLVILELTPEQLNMFRDILTRRPDQFENAAGILRMIGQ